MNWRPGKPLKGNSTLLSTQQLFTVLLTSLFLLFLYTLFPFDFYLPKAGHVSNGIRLPGLSWHDITTFDTALNWANIAEIFSNVFLFSLLSSSLFCLLMKKSKSSHITLYALALFLFPFFLELLQLFIPLRKVNISDIAFSEIGIIYGFLAVNCRFLKKNSPLFIFELIKAGLIHYKFFFLIFLFFYVFITPLLFIKFRVFNELAMWNTNYTLLIGNEKDNSRPWSGMVRELSISNQSFSLDQVDRWLKNLRVNSELWLGVYRFNPQSSTYGEQKGTLPELKEKLTDNTLYSSYESAEPVSQLIENIRKTNQFTIGISLTSLSKYQTGPARIASISNGKYHRNITLGQSNTDLVIRLRTPISGFNGARPEYVIPGVFADSLTHNIVASYSSPHLKIYVDNPENLTTIKLPITKYKFTLYSLFLIPLLFLVFFKDRAKG